MNMILGYIPLDYIYLHSATLFSNAISYEYGYFSSEYLFSILGDPHYMNVYRKFGMGAMPVVHLVIILLYAKAFHLKVRVLNPPKMSNNGIRAQWLPF
jgi:hypothetical protein